MGANIFFFTRASRFDFFFFSTCLFVVLISNRLPYTMKILLVLATILATISAYCPNGCNKNGSCGLNGEFVVIFIAYSLLLHSQLFSSCNSSIIIL